MCLVKVPLEFLPSNFSVLEGEYTYDLRQAIVVYTADILRQRASLIDTSKSTRTSVGTLAAMTSLLPQPPVQGEKSNITRMAEKLIVEMIAVYTDQKRNIASSSFAGNASTVGGARVRSTGAVRRGSKMLPIRPRRRYTALECKVKTEVLVSTSSKRDDSV